MAMHASNSSLVRSQVNLLSMLDKKKKKSTTVLDSVKDSRKQHGKVMDTQLPMASTGVCMKHIHLHTYVHTLYIHTTYMPAMGIAQELVCLSGMFVCGTGYTPPKSNNNSNNNNRILINDYV